MTVSLVEEASKQIPNTQVLINVISKRVRQLATGHRPMLDPGPRVDYADIALREVIAGKIGFEFLSEDAAAEDAAVA